MISVLRGIIASKSANSAVVDVGGIGYLLSMSMDAVSKLPSPGEQATVLCRMIVTDNSVALYGFSCEGERDLFDHLITVSGIGPKTALSALSYYSFGDLIAAIVSQDVKAISKIPGLGKKSASRIILELKDRFPEAKTSFDDALFGQSSPAMDGVREALKTMGFTSEEIDSALKDADGELSESALLQYALKRLG